MLENIIASILGTIEKSPFVLNYKEFASGNKGYSGKISAIVNDKLYVGFVNMVEQTENTHANAKKYQEKIYKPEYIALQKNTKKSDIEKLKKSLLK